jgi:hypothetical protein
VRGNRTDRAPLLGLAVRLPVAMLVMFAALAWTGQARAHGGSEGIEDDPTPAPGWAGHRTTLAFDLGLASALGELGASGAFWPRPFTGTELGLGLGITGVQCSLMQKFTVARPESSVRFLFGAGLSYAAGTRNTTGSILWLNLDMVGFEVRTPGHLLFFMSTGLTVGLRGGKFVSTQQDSGRGVLTG